MPDALVDAGGVPQRGRRMRRRWSTPRRTSRRPQPASTCRSSRDETAGHRVKAERADALAARLVTAQAALTDDGFVDDARVQAAVEYLVRHKPPLAARRPTGDVGQGACPETPEMGLAAMLRRGS